MGFGAGITAAARRGVASLSSSVLGLASWRVEGLRIPGDLTRVAVVTPERTAFPRDLGLLRTEEDWNAYGAMLAMPRGGVFLDEEVRDTRAQRSVLGDARDLLVDVLRRRLGSTVNDRGEIWFAGSSARLVQTDEGPEYLTYATAGSGALFIHVGPTEKARQILREACSGNPAWDGDLAHLDGDGYVTLLVRNTLTQEKHLILAGPTEYASYFAVADFLQQDPIGARWLFPGPDGEVIPAAGAVTLPAINRFEEPDVRSRTMTNLASEKHHSIREIDAARAWQLRNRMRPHLERAYIMQVRWPQNRLCGIPSWETGHLWPAFVYATLETEERIPSGHVMNLFLSPFRGRADDATGAIPRARSTPSIYPDRRPRDFSRPSTPAGLLDNRQGSLDASVTINTVPDPEACPGDVPMPCCPVLASLEGTMVTRLVLPSGAAETVKDIGAFSFIVPESVTGGVELKRFIPRAYSHHLSGNLSPFDKWHPCIFEYAGRPGLGEHMTARRSLAADVATQLRVATMGRGIRGHENAHSLSLVDGDGWCWCDACTRVDDTGGPGDHLLFYRGLAVAHPVGVLERECPVLQSVPHDLTLQDSALVGGLSAYAWTEYAIMSFTWSAAGNPFRDLSLDALAQRGVLHAKGYPHTRTRRVLSLLNAVCVQFGLLGGATGMAPPGSAPVFGFHAYNAFVSPPLRGDDANSEVCHASLMPYLTGLRDTSEYGEHSADPYDRVTPGTLSGSFTRLQDSPDQFNTERWSTSARQIGFYEYFLSGYGYVGPHLYTGRLQRAIERGVRHHRLRGFTSETFPNWGFDAPMLWETTRILWNPSAQSAAELRTEFCRAAFGAGALPMRMFFNLCEEAWSATRDEWRLYDGAAGERPYPDRHLRSGASGGYFGDGYGGRVGFLSTLDGFYGAPSAGSQPTRLLQAWAHLELAYRATSPGSPERQRVQMFRRSFGLTLLIGTWYRPFYIAFDTLRRNLNVIQMQRIGQFAGVQGTEGRPGTGLVFPVVGQETDTRNATAAPVKTRTLYRPSVPQAGRVPLRAALTPVRARLDPVGDRSVNGLLRFRNEVHRYLACDIVDIASASMETFPTFDADNDLRRLRDAGALRDVGLGVFSVSTLAENAPFPVLPPQNQFAPVNTTALSTYVAWWNGAATYTPRGGTPMMATPEMRSQSLRAEDADPGLGWFFKTIKEMAGCLLGYSNDIPSGISDDINALCVNG